MPDSPSGPPRHVNATVGRPAASDDREQVPSPHSGGICVRVEGDARLDPEKMGLAEDLAHLVADIVRAPALKSDAAHRPESAAQVSPDLTILMGTLQLEPIVQAHL